MSVPRSNPLDDNRWDFDSKKPIPSAPDIKKEMRFFTIIGLASDALWHHRLRHHYIGYPKTLHTCGINAFWAGVWFCATKSSNWTYAAIAKDRNRIVTTTMPACDGIWDHGRVSTAHQLETESSSRKAEWLHSTACCSFTIIPVFVRLIYAYRPWFWQRHLPFKMMWLCGAASTSCMSMGASGAVVQSRSRLEKDTVRST